MDVPWGPLAGGIALVALVGAVAAMVLEALGDGTQVDRDDDGVHREEPGEPPPAESTASGPR